MKAIDHGFTRLPAWRWHSRTLLVMGMLCCSVAVSSAPMAATVPASGKLQAQQVEIRNFAFVPATLTVSSGTRVVWTNRDEEPHVITSAGALFASSKGLDTGDSYAVTFSKPGTYAYFCSIHPMMVGTIIVQ